MSVRGHQRRNLVITVLMEGQIPLVVESIAKRRRITPLRMAGIELLHGTVAGNIPGAVHRLALRTRDGGPLLYRDCALDCHLGGKVKLCSTNKELSQHVMADPATAH